MEERIIALEKRVAELEAMVEEMSNFEIEMFEKWHEMNKLTQKTLNRQTEAIECNARSIGKIGSILKRIFGGGS